MALCARLLHRQLGRLLKLVDLETGGKAVATPEFALCVTSQPAPSVRQNPRVRYESIPSYARNEPRLALIHNNLARTLRLGHYASQGSPIAVDGFRLRELRQWANFPVATPQQAVGSLSSFCNCDCEFCFEKGTRESAVSLGRSQLSQQEARTRLRYYSPEKHTGIIRSNRFSLEPFANPHCLEILDAVHQAEPEALIDLITNGACLTEEAVAYLARLKPIFLSVSLNAASVETRLRSVRDRKRSGAETALASLRLLQQYEIPFIGSYVPWPTKPLEDMEAFVRLVDRYDGVAARVCLPTWTRHSHQQPPFDADQYWPEIVSRVDRLRREVSVPIDLMLNMYQLRSLRPFILGTLKHSPAAQAGLRYGDLITAIDGEPVFTRPETAAFLAQRSKDRAATSIRFTIERKGEEMDVTISRDDRTLGYPYRQLCRAGVPSHWADALGIYMADGFGLSDFLALKPIVTEHAGKCILFFMSELAVSPLLEGMDLLGEAAAFFQQADLHVQRLRPQYLGGNVIAGDLWMVEDIVAGARQWMARNKKRPDLLVVPATFLSYGGRDLQDRCYLEIERELGIEVRLLRCRRLMG